MKKLRRLFSWLRSKLNGLLNSMGLVITSSLPLDSEKAALCLNSLGRQADICQLLVSQVTKKDGRNITTVGELVYIIISSQYAAQADEPLPLLQEAL